MTTQQVVDIGTRTLMVAAQIAGPFMAVILGVGVIVGLLQSVTQIQEPTLTFVPKLVGAGVVVAVGGNWMLATLISFAHQLVNGVPALLKG